MKTSLRNFFSPTSMLDTGAEHYTGGEKAQSIVGKTRGFIFPHLLTIEAIAERMEQSSKIEW